MKKGCFKVLILFAGFCLIGSAAFATDVYFLLDAQDDGTNPITSDHDRIVVTGKPTDGSGTAGGTSDECGNYYNGSSYEDSAVFNSMELTVIKALDGNNGKAGRLPDAWFAGTRPDPGSVYSGVALYTEHASDDGKCIDDFTGESITYYKVSGTND